MTLSRRHFIQNAYAVGLFYAGFGMAGCATAFSANSGMKLVPDPRKLLDLPEGFSYVAFGETGGTMADGFFRPGRHDGMACFADPTSADKCILMRNHENWVNIPTGSPFGKGNELLDRVSKKQLYDRKVDGSPFFGGVTKVVYDLKNKRMESDYLVLTGTAANCAGGSTPWGSWLTCEEQMLKPPQEARKYHGFVFETPSSATGLIDAVPLKDMGRFAHEAAAVDPSSGIVYMTEDTRDALFYRFLPKSQGRLEKGGKLQALAIKGWKSAVTNNWAKDWGGSSQEIPVGQEYEVEWIDMKDVTSPDGDLNRRGHAAGAAYFCRGEGMDFGIRPGSNVGEVFFTCTQGGKARTGQVWRYTPGGTADEGGKLTLIYESQSADTLDLCDNLVLAPWGDIILCEDGLGSQYLRGLTPDGKIYDFAKNSHKDDSEFCGACFSPDGKTMFVNVQNPGTTFAITGPWETLRV